MNQGDPQVVAAPVFVIGSIALALQLVECVSPAALGAPIAIILAWQRAVPARVHDLGRSRRPVVRRLLLRHLRRLLGIFGLVMVALCFVAAAHLMTPVDTDLLKVAGDVVFVFAGLGMSLSWTVMSLSLGGPAFPPLGPAIVRPRPAPPA